MFDEEPDPSCPYDNVEFPLRKPGTGTWPGPGGGGGGGVGGGGGGGGVGGAGSGARHYGHQATRSLGGAGPKLAPLIEVDGSESAENHRLHAMAASTKTATSTSATKSAFTSSSSSSSSLSSSQAKQIPFQDKTPSVTSLNGLMTSSNKLKGTATVAGSTTTTTSSKTTFATTTATTGGASASTVTSSTASGNQQTEKDSKPVIAKTNDSNTYVATEVTYSDGQRKSKSTLNHQASEDEDFKRQDLNPASRAALEKVYTNHVDFYQLNSKVLDEGSLLKQDVLDIYRNSGESLTYEQLLQGMLVDGERFLLANCWLLFTHVQFLDVEGTKVLREPYGRGRVGLTSKRVLFLSTETYTDANFQQFGDMTPRQGGYKLEVSKRKDVTFKNIPLSNFHSAEMEATTGTAAQTKITKKYGCCSCLGISSGAKWVSTPPMTRSITSRVVRVGVSMPPWQTRMFLDIYLDPSMSLTVARDFISQLHTFAPHMH